MDMDNKSTKTSIHIYTLTRLPLYHSFLFVPLYRYIPFGSNTEEVRAFTQTPEICLSTSTSQDRSRHGRRLVPLTRTRRFFFFFFSKIFAPLPYCFFSDLLYIYPFFAALFSFSSLVSFFFSRGRILRPCNDSHHVLFFLFLLSYLSGASSPSLKCITVRRVSHTILQGGG